MVLGSVAWAATSIAGQHAELAGGGDVSLRREGDVVTVTVNGPRAGLASLCLADGSRIRILHASAAIGEAIYERSDERWRLKSGFDWQLRDTPGARGRSPNEANAFFERNGWVANASAAGSPRRTFRIRRGAAASYLGVIYLSTDDSMAISYWPDGIADDCRLVNIAQGRLPETATFRPESWRPLVP
jgi:hypothetical protein